MLQPSAECLLQRRVLASKKVEKCRWKTKRKDDVLPMKLYPLIGSSVVTQTWSLFLFVTIIYTLCYYCDIFFKILG